MKLVDLTRDGLVTALADLYGYGVDDFDGQTKAEIWEYLSDAQQDKVIEYLDAEV